MASTAVDGPLRLESSPRPSEQSEAQLAGKEDGVTRSISKEEQISQDLQLKHRVANLERLLDYSIERISALEAYKKAQESGQMLKVSTDNKTIAYGHAHMKENAPLSVNLCSQIEILPSEDIHAQQAIPVFTSSSTQTHGLNPVKLFGEATVIKTSNGGVLPEPSALPFDPTAVDFQPEFTSRVSTLQNGTTPLEDGKLGEDLENPHSTLEPALLASSASTHSLVQEATDTSLAAPAKLSSIVFTKPSKKMITSKVSRFSTSQPEQFVFVEPSTSLVAVPRPIETVTVPIDDTKTVSSPGKTTSSTVTESNACKAVAVTEFCKVCKKNFVFPVAINDTGKQFAKTAEHNEKYHGFCRKCGEEVPGEWASNNYGISSFNYHEHLEQCQAPERDMWSNGNVFGTLSGAVDQPISNAQAQTPLMKGTKSYKQTNKTLSKPSIGRGGSSFAGTSAAQEPDNMSHSLLHSKAPASSKRTAKPLNRRGGHITPEIQGYSPLAPRQEVDWTLGREQSPSLGGWRAGSSYQNASAGYKMGAPATTPAVTEPDEKPAKQEFQGLMGSKWIS